ncbi:efflux transporter outer membrane subunit [Xanthomonas sp. WHRI 8391]|uniref:Toluene efflux pump outer membrane protein TtgI n=1 Tax=Xanthomonas hortorum pv. carotae TaxID=487904 RepID=A0A6V7DAX9_9XANT|nr:efflux transporter outer membrane subunit [Xanthomonas hortorum]MBG3852167.1 efflux transporter outer membrane subunit [Xanthomonas hortorum pv. carotae]UTS72554.1 efflux transporter outer membrane subunit [Xanthomonas hortorum]CAD0331282.1 Toluene efflux pump outer membrane protein TtgI [Xanthomonas hortorum pv. carotae]CAD0331291.1 Toluene efflux pump outer membrane protein TtgI [Xanthomonas hortorum pv. carotae]
MRLIRMPLAAALSAVLLGGCMLGPNYTKAPVVADAAIQAPALHRASGAEVVAAAPLNHWWEELHDPMLTQLVTQALADSPNLRAAQARLLANRALARQRRAERLPKLNASALYAYAEPPQTIVDTLGNLQNGQNSQPPAAGSEEASLDKTQIYSVGFDASWELDLFGRRRRAAEGALAQAQASEAELADAQVQLAAEVGQVYLNYRGLQARLAIADANLDKIGQTLRLTQQRREQGAASDLQVEQIATQVQQQQAQRLPLDMQSQEALDQLALMVGREPGALDTQLSTAQPLPMLPTQVRVDDAGALIRRRPDVRKAERELAASSAQIGEALNGYFPQVTLLGGLSWVAGSPGDFNSDALTTLAVPMLRWSIFDFGRTKAQVAQARAGNAGREAAYEGAVLGALQDANSALARFGSARKQLVVARQAEASATRSAGLMQQRRDAGATSSIDLLDVQRQQLSAQDAAAQAQVQLLVNYVALQKSLGLGWSEPAQEAR